MHPLGLRPRRELWQEGGQYWQYGIARGQQTCPHPRTVRVLDTAIAVPLAGYGRRDERSLRTRRLPMRNRLAAARALPYLM